MVTYYYIQIHIMYISVYFICANCWFYNNNNKSHNNYKMPFSTGAIKCRVCCNEQFSMNLFVVRIKVARLKTNHFQRACLWRDFEVARLKRTFRSCIFVARLKVGVSKPTIFNELVCGATLKWRVRNELSVRVYLWRD